MEEFEDFPADRPLEHLPLRLLQEEGEKDLMDLQQFSKVSSQEHQKWASIDQTVSTKTLVGIDVEGSLDFANCHRPQCHLALLPCLDGLVVIQV